MHLTKRLFWLTLTFLVPLNPTFPSYGRDIALEAFEGSSVFTDTGDHWANLCLDGVGSEGLMRGYPDKSFQPNKTMTRAEFAAVMIQAFPNAPKLREAPNFKDVAKDFWGKAAIATAYEKGFLTGYPDNVFKPAQPISRVQAVVVLASAQKLSPSTNSVAILQQYFDDAAAVPIYAKGLTAVATQQALVVNYPKVSELRPNSSITRGEAAALLCRLNAAGTDARYFVNDQYIANFGSGLDNITLPKPIVLHSITTTIYGFLQTHATLRDHLFFFIGDSLWMSDGTPSGTRLVSPVEAIEPGLTLQNPRVIAASKQRFWMTAGAFVGDNSAGTRLLGSDGTAAGTIAVATLHPDLFSLFSRNYDLLVANKTLEGDRLPFVLEGDAGSELWITDGKSTAGTQRLATFDRIERADKRVPIYGTGSVPLPVSGEYVFFQATRSSDKENMNITPKLELWRSDGTVEGTISLGEVDRLSLDTLRTAPPNRIYAQLPFSASFPELHELWTSDGMQKGTQKWLKTEDRKPVLAPDLLTSLGDRFFTLAHFEEGLELWATQGSNASTRMVKRLNSDMDSAQYTPPWFAVDGDKLFFTVAVARPESSDNEDNTPRKQELWMTKGSAETTIKLGDLGASGEGVIPFKGRLFFNGISEETGSELWTTDGTPAGTHEVMDLVPGTDAYQEICPSGSSNFGTVSYCQRSVAKGSEVRSLTVHGDFLYFIADGGLFRTDGTGKNIQHVRSFMGGPSGDFPPNIVKVNETLFVMGFGDDEPLLWALPEK